jgi:hypothetical protein
MLTPDQITLSSFNRIANDLLQKQAEYCAQYLRDEIGRWDETFVSDDGTDYVQTTLDATETLMRIRYEGTPEDLRDFLFTSRVEYERLLDTDQIAGTKRFLYGEPLCVIDSAGGLHPELSELSNHIIESTED